MFSPQTGRSTEGLRFRVDLLKTAPESPTCRPCRAPPSPRQLDVAERPTPGPHSMNPWEPVEGRVPYVETVRIPYVYFHGLALEPVFPGRLPATSKRVTITSNLPYASDYCPYVYLLLNLLREGRSFHSVPVLSWTGTFSQCYPVLLSG